MERKVDDETIFTFESAGIRSSDSRAGRRNNDMAAEPDRESKL